MIGEGSDLHLIPICFRGELIEIVKRSHANYERCLENGECSGMLALCVALLCSPRATAVIVMRGTRKVRRNYVYRHGSRGGFELTCPNIAKLQNEPVCSCGWNMPLVLHAARAVLDRLRFTRQYICHPLWKDRVLLDLSMSEHSTLGSVLGLFEPRLCPTLPPQPCTRARRFHGTLSFAPN